MRLLAIYISRYIFQASFLVLCLLIGLDIFIQALRELHDLTHHYPFQSIITTVLLNMPLDIYQFLPVIIVLGVLGGVGHLARSSELTIMQAAGFSNKQLLTTVWIATAAIILIISLVGEGLGPRLARMAIQHKLLAISTGRLLTTQQGLWIKEKNAIMHIQNVLSNNKIGSITRYTFTPHNQLNSISYAKSGQFIHHHWLFDTLCETTFNTVRKQAQSACYAHKSLPIHLSNSVLLNSAKITPDLITLPKLYTIVRINNNSASVEQRYLLWKRLSHPCLAWLMAGLLIPGMVFVRRGAAGLQGWLAGLLGLTFYMISQSIGSIGIVYGIPPFIAATALPLGGFLLGQAAILKVYKINP